MTISVWLVITASVAAGVLIGLSGVAVGFWLVNSISITIERINERD